MDRDACSFDSLASAIIILHMTISYKSPSTTVSMQDECAIVYVSANLSVCISCGFLATIYRIRKNIGGSNIWRVVENMRLARF